MDYRTISNTITEKSIDYVHISLGDIHSTTKVSMQDRAIEINSPMGGWSYPVIGVGSVFTADDALDAIESTGVELVTWS